MKKSYIICFLISTVLCFPSCSNPVIINEYSVASSAEIVNATVASYPTESKDPLSAIKEVVMNRTSYLCTENNQFVYLKDPLSNNYLIINDKGFYEYLDGNDEKEIFVFTDFCVIDIDEDGSPEILLQSETSNIFLFRYQNNIIYNYVFPYRGMLDIKKDGSFTVSGGAATLLVGKIKFQNNECIFNELCRFDGLDEPTPVYRINGKTVERDAVEEYLKKEDEKKNAEWYMYDEINIEKYLK